MKVRRRFVHKAKIHCKLGSTSRRRIAEAFRSMGWSTGIWWDQDNGTHIMKVTQRSDSHSCPPMPSGEYTCKDIRVS